MHILNNLFNTLIHLDSSLEFLVGILGNWIYVLLFLVVFAETGLVIMPFLPGDSLLFVSGTLAGSGYINILIVYFTLFLSAIVGDTVNYWIGHSIGAKVFNKDNSKIFKKEYLEKTREFYEKHGAKAIILARFLPILRTFAPFVAGVGKMHYKTFILFNILGAFLWTTLFTFMGFFFGGLEVVQHNFHYVVFGILFISVLPMVFEFIKYRQGLHLSKSQLVHATYKEVVETIEEDVEHIKAK